MSDTDTDIPITDIERPEAWAIAERLGFNVTGDGQHDAILSVHLDPSEIAVITADRNEHGNKFVVENERGERVVSSTVHRFRYADVQREYDEADTRRAAREQSA